MFKNVQNDVACLGGGAGPPQKCTELMARQLVEPSFFQVLLFWLFRARAGPVSWCWARIMGHILWCHKGPPDYRFQTPTPDYLPTVWKPIEYSFSNIFEFSQRVSFVPAVQNLLPWPSQLFFPSTFCQLPAAEAEAAVAKSQMIQDQMMMACTRLLIGPTITSGSLSWTNWIFTVRWIHPWHPSCMLETLVAESSNTY